MYLLYVDESDTTGGERAESRIYCVCGLRVVDSSYGQTTKRLTKVIESWKPSLPSDLELKGYELFRGTGCWAGREPKERAAFAQAVAEALAQSTIKLFVAMKASEDFGDDYRTLLGHVIAQAAKDTDKKGSKTGRQMMLVFDQRPDFNVRSSTALHDMRAEVISKHGASLFIDHGYEADSRHAPLIQAADFVAFHLRKRETLRRDDSLLGSKADGRLIEALDRLHETLAPKAIFIKN
jgi:Protein of unknown function (DUF3800)